MIRLQKSYNIELEFFACFIPTTVQKHTCSSMVQKHTHVQQYFNYHLIVSLTKNTPQLNMWLLTSRYVPASSTFI